LVFRSFPNFATPGEIDLAGASLAVPRTLHAA